MDKNDEIKGFELNLILNDYKFLLNSITDIPSPAPLSPAPHSWRFEVFLSFSGQDTRGNFTDHLLSGLLERQVKAYRDDKNLPRGSFISKALLRAIERSKISIIVFSKNYAASRWSLDELVKIIKCRKLLGHIILPVFFDVRPDHVAKQTGPYKKIFRKYEEKYKNNKQKVEKWKDALKTVAEISGWDKENYRSESKLIRIIAKKVVRKLRKAAPTVGNQLVQLNSKVEEMKLKLYEKWEEIGTIKFYGLQWGRKIWDSSKDKKRWQSQHVSEFCLMKWTN
ncbi:disease resistance protein RPV1-like [Manihot esculenta]|uniref:disease resistance protein RPV1-like n=1 Tax=Manihot esculenta TaxID=3983 RepID=UPI001CC3F0A4|nr:disease resistance protein RPV1-like [Manihot esculenta]